MLFICEPSSMRLATDLVLHKRDSRQSFIPIVMNIWHFYTELLADLRIKCPAVSHSYAQRIKGIKIFSNPLVIGHLAFPFHCV